jgi:DNA-binding MarR family transcriptional regulator
MAKKETICSRIKQSWLSISRMYNSEAVNHDLTTSVGFILLNIDTKEGTPSTSIGPLMGMEATSLSRTLNALEKKGLIERKKDLVDARVTRIFLTEKGKQKKEISKKTVKEFNNELLEKIGEEKIKIFNEVIEQISEISSLKKFNAA